METKRRMNIKKDCINLGKKLVRVIFDQMIKQHIFLFSLGQVIDSAPLILYFRKVQVT